MEQKQLDEIDESYFGEEFIDEAAEEVMKEGEGSEKKGNSSSKLKGSSLKKMKKSSVKSSVPKEKEADDDHSSEVKIISLKEENDIKDSPTKKEEAVLKASKEAAEKSSPPVDPWAKEEQEGSFFKEASTWKAVTGIVIILLIFSVFTEGFKFSGGSFAAQELILPLSDAEKKALEYVNTNLVQAPFLASVSATKDVGKFYKITFAVAGQTVDSYLTKDGKMFFPVGYNTSKSLSQQIGGEELNVNPGGVNTATEGSPIVSGEEVQKEVVGEETISADNETKVVLEEETEVPVAKGDSREFSLTAKRWLFSPTSFTVNKGDNVVLTINPQNLDFTFGIPELGVEEEVKGPTTVEFTASKEGTFMFSCRSCEAWRGMQGEIIVK
ncbi:cupredoxin domain-containing protein [Candidatus Woesearchaeota archaeon]|nr:cupredoxin domain-containing protein [Candidatus Woesearchaeota archaeon]